MTMKLRFSENSINELAARYNYGIADDYILGIAENIKKNGFMNKEDLFSVARWKAPRSAGNVDKNTEEFVREITEMSLCAKDERVRIEVLTLLDGVLWPTASVILHLFHVDKYPILDYRALWSVSLDVPSQYNFKFWWPYVVFCRGVASRNNVDMRTLDKALWQYSKENQR